MVAQRITTCSPNAPEYGYYIATILRNEITVGPPPKSSVKDILPAERRIYNDLARRIQKRFEELESEKSKRRDRRSVKPLTNSMQE